MKLKRELKFLDVFCIATGAMISSGLFILPGLAHAQAGPSVVISYMIAGLLAIAGMLSQAELVSAMPKAGGDYFYVTRSMGPAIGTINGILTWISISLKSAFALVGMAAFSILVVDYDPKMIAACFCLFFVVINIIGVKVAGRFQVWIVLLLLAILFVYIVRGLPAVELSNFRNFAPNGIPAIFSTAGFVFVSYGGLLKVASIAEEVKNPGKVVPMGMMLSLLVVGILYALIVFITSGVLDPGQLNQSLMPLSDGAAVFMGRWGKILLSIGAILAFVSTANAGVMSASRYPLALSRDHLLPGFVNKLHSVFKTPYVAVIITGILMITALFFNIYVLVEVASTVLIFTFIFSCICVIIMRESGVQNYRPKFHAPFYPWIQLFGIFGCWLLVVNMGKEALFIASLSFACGLAVFWFYGRQQAKRDFALLHLIERVAPKELIGVSLETELKEIILERDDVIKDRFDKIIEKSDVIDIEKSIKMEAFFEIASKKIASKLKIKKEIVLESLSKREEQSSTVVGPGLAIPHIIIDGKEKFYILLVRSKKGITFPGKQKVHTVFVIAGARNERNFHLRALSAIAQIVEDPKFKDRWFHAKDENALRDLVLLGKRKRSI